MMVILFDYEECQLIIAIQKNNANYISRGKTYHLRKSNRKILRLFFRIFLIVFWV